MSKRNSIDLSDFEFEIDDMEYLIKNRVNPKNIKEKEDEVMPPHLPPEIIYAILDKIPPEHLYQEFKLVCKAWKNIISGNTFVVDTFARIKPGFLVQHEFFSYYKAYRMEINEKQLNYKLHDVKLNKKGQFRSSCYGMMLMDSQHKNRTNHPNPEIVLQVVNFATNFYLKLPECPSGCPHNKCGVVLGFDPCTNLFKVVHMHGDGFGVEIFTIGDSSNDWKKISGPLKSSSERGWSDPVSINGRFLYWNVLSPKFILCMDVSDEKISKIELPYDSGQESIWQSYHLLELGGHLSVTNCSSNGRMDIWILQDTHGKLWFKKHSIDANMIDYYIKTSRKELRSPDFKLLIPVAGTTNGVLVLRHAHHRCIYLYDTKKRVMKKFKTCLVGNLILDRSILFKEVHYPHMPKTS